MALFRRPRLFEPAGSKGFQVRLAPEARDWVVGLADELDEIARQCSRLPVRDGRAADEILGYDEDGLPR